LNPELGKVLLREEPRIGTAVPERRRGTDRRRTTLRTFVQGALTPRRRAVRRTEEQHLPIDWHEPYLLFVAIMILLLSTADAFLTLTLLTKGAHEANPFLAYLLEDHPGLFAAVKMGLTGLGVVVLVAMARATVFRRIRVGVFLNWFMLGYMGLIAYEWWLLSNLL
jgi:hypothetical protein